MRHVISDRLTRELYELGLDTPEALLALVRAHLETIQALTERPPAKKRAYAVAIAHLETAELWLARAGDLP